MIEVGFFLRGFFANELRQISQRRFNDVASQNLSWKMHFQKGSCVLQSNEFYVSPSPIFQVCLIHSFFILLCFLVSTPIFGCCFQSIHGNGIFTRFVFVRRQYLVVLLFWQPISDNDIFKAYLFSHQWLKNTQLSTPCHLRLFSIQKV